MKNLREIRKARGKTVRECAEHLHTSHASWTRWESLRSDVSSVQANAIADLFGVTLDQLHGRTEFHPTPVTPSEVA